MTLAALAKRFSAAAAADFSPFREEELAVAAARVRSLAALVETLKQRIDGKNQPRA